MPDDRDQIIAEHHPAAGEPAASGFAQTPSQTVGPFFGYALPYADGPSLVPPRTPGSIRLHGTVLDGAGDPVPDALIELWQADADGRPVAVRGSLARDGFTFTGFGRAAVDGGGHYSFSTLKPGPGRAGRAPFVLITVFARGLLHHLFTRAYFDDEIGLNGIDPFLASVEEDRRSTLLAHHEGGGSYRFDIRLQGDGETVFLQYPGIAR
ncbi:protocatechuate 3,4-dioxygenase subunit alpha [Cnuibacter physcomitrellae]|uniref:Protocatechuate 3,4-dioxygenase subunit alpha n=1 Tax=Cnuibacter physcomitrellae TaxID=1619308 RepID=A0A1X9LGK8_9MICO|nr:protocatechuate 3,4-dioxygenase subunit alpha [Cnuibacter physcomitrellae]ARJ04314.1 protocatechuate 3,4-dioxygenase subunit alpha [Cnuibacter physcomitrellae]GGI40748.1 protocatechuate 3,4-dioxygenase subunit alpha [Cnuibacter physcomitrellae]